MTTTIDLSLWCKTYYAFLPAIAGFAYGWVNASTSRILTMPWFLSYFHIPTAYRQGTMTASQIAVEFGGSLQIRFLFSGRLGRRVAILLRVLVYLISQAVITASQNQGLCITERAVNWLGAGGSFQTITLVSL